jgi:hypothetical protein
MAFSTQFTQIERISEVVGVRAALMLAGFFGKQGQRIYIPVVADPKHIISKLIGREAFRDLVDAYGGQNLTIPECDLKALRRAGQIHRLSVLGVPIGDQALATGIGTAGVKLVQDELRREGFFSLADHLTESEGGHCD